MTRYELFTQIGELCKMQQTGENQFNKMIQSGELNSIHFDYNRGYYDVCIEYTNQGGKGHFVRIWFGTIDNGDFGAWVECDTREKALSLLSEVVNKFNDIVVCPNLDNLNKEFEKLGVYFCNE